MTANKPSKKTNTSAPGVKMLITAASLAATVGGWALISGNEAKPAPAPAPASQPTATTSAITIKFAPLPTLVPPLTPQPKLVTVNQPRQAAAAPQPAASNTVVLRDVSAPPQASGGGGVSAPGAAAPAPVANTKSSR